MTLIIPTVTMADLQHFHARHFAASHTNSESSGPEGAVEAVFDEDDALGSYPDGVKRTLTDEQVQIFRHSELQRYKKEKELREEQERQDAVTDADFENGVERNAPTAGTKDGVNDAPQQRSNNVEAPAPHMSRRLIRYDDD